MERMRDLHRRDIQGLAPGDNGFNPVAGLPSTEALHTYLQNLQLDNVPCHSPREFLNLIHRRLVANQYKETDAVKSILDNDEGNGVVWVSCTDGGLVGYCERTQAIYCELPNGEALLPVRFGG